ncbi:leucine-rich repeat protein [Paenibacillus oryzisoli]|uniref:SLH domain-containing protein n=1 Tax=Paenibacillus oryzisoli TaxID=1850517 RepID=A0A198AC81_9BACL|nr:leucine-rich repeat protein [Paenibacillus oryzisoli]OAS18671.1 hypothetical protein A8708_29070 [Paenibacillus oryzisoli]
MKKSVVCLFIALFTFGTSFSQILPVYAAENDFTFTIGSNGATVTDYKGTDLNVVIPAAYSGTPVTEIGRSAFDTYGTGKPKITSVVIPSSVKVIQTYGFRYTSLTSIELPDSLLTIGSSAFENNPLTTVVFPDSVTMIGNYSFYMNSLTSIKLSENLKTINGGAFDTNHISKLVIPAGVTNVASSSFYSNNLTSVTVLGNATTFGTSVFASNPSNLKIFGIANSPAAVYASSNGHTFVDGTTLFQAVSSAKSLLKSYPVGTGVGQVPANAYNDLSAEYDAAKLVIDGIGNATTVSDLANAATPLTASIAAFNAQIVQAGNPAALAAAITVGQQALTDHPQGLNVGQVPAGARSTLQTATQAAQQIFANAGNYTQDQLDTAVSQLNAAVQVFTAAVIQAGVPTALGAEITVAQQALTDHPQGVNVGQASAGTRTVLQTATQAAQQIFDNAGNYTQDQLDTAVNQLNAAVQVFTAAVLQAGVPTALGSVIAVAQQALTDHPQGTDVGQASAGARSTLQTAIQAAQQIFDNAGNYTQAQLDTAVGQLNAAVQVFNAAVVQAGVPTALGAAIAVAQQALTDHPQGTDVGQASAGTRTALQTALDAAQQIFDDAGNYTQDQLDTAVSQLNAAVQVFTAAVIQAGVPTALGAAITVAQQALTDHPQGTDVGQASAVARTALQTATQAAQQIFDNAGNYTQDQLDTAVTQLNAAVQVFNTAVVQAGVPTALGAAITVAQQALTDHPQGMDVGQAPAVARTVLQTALDGGQQVFDDAGNYTQDQLDTAVNQLNAAVQVFTAAVVQAGVPTALGSAITVAQQALTDHPQGTDVGQASAVARTALQNATQAAQQIFDNAGNYTQDQLDTAVTQLNAAVQVFNTAVVQAGVPTALGAAIAIAQQALTDHPQGVNVGQASAVARTALQTANQAAQQIFDNAGNYTQDQLDTAVIQLNAAVQVFTAAVVQAGVPTALGAAITVAQQALTDHPQGTDVGQASAVARTALQNATQAAQQIFDNAGNYTQDQLDTAVTQLNAAVQVFNTAVVQAGVPTALGAAIAIAQQALTDHPQGVNVGQASAVARTALQTANQAAQQIFDNAGNYTQDQLDTAVIQLNAAVQVFTAAVVQAGVPTALGAAITVAQQALTDHPAGTDVGQTSAGTRTALETSLDAAQQIFDDAGNYTQDQLDTAVTQLNAAVQVFTAAVIQAGVPTALGAAITVAQQALTDHPAGTDVGQTSAGTRTALETSLDAAQQIFDIAGNYTQDQLDTAVTQLNAAVQVFTAAVIQAGVPTALGSAITVAQQALTDHPAGTDVGQTSAGTRTALETSLDAAQQIFDDAGNYTQDQLDTAVTQLNAAVQVFTAALIQAGVPTALGAAIAIAQQALTDHPQGTDVGQASAAARTALQTALDAAQQIFDNAGNYTQDQLDTAVTQLNAAVQVFTAAVVQAGVPTALGAAIAIAQQALTDHPQGTDVGQASAVARTALQTAIQAAQQIFDIAGNYTQDQLDTAVTQLHAAVQVFTAAVIQAGVPTALGAAITAAQQALTDHPQGTDVGQASAGTRTALQTEIQAAQQIFDNVGNYTQDQLDTAVTQLNAAVQVFNTAVVQAGVPTALGAAITAAQQALTDHPQGTDVGQASAVARTALQTAILAAQQIFDNMGNYTQDQLDTAVTQLNAAVQVFTAAVIQAGIPTALEAAITAAKQALTAHPEGTDVGQTSAGDRAVLQTAIDAGQAIADDAENQSQTRLDEATVSLNDAMAVFEAAWVGVVLTASANDLYGTSDTLRFTVFYGDEVMVIGTPVVPVMVGDNSVAQTVYAPYMGARGEAVKKLTFEFEVPAGLADIDGIQVAASLELPNGASIVRTSNGLPATLTYAAPNVSGIRIVGIPPEVALTVAPNGSERKVISVTASVYGEAAGNALTQLRWLAGSLSGGDFAGGTKGNDILATPQFTVTANGDYTIYALDEVGNEAVKTITVTGISIPSSSDNGILPVISGTTVKFNLNGGITMLVDPSDIKQVKRSDGTMIEQVILPERTREQVLELLKDAREPIVSIAISNREQAVQAQFQADWIADMVKAYPNTIIEVRLNDSSYQLRLSAIDLISLAERLNAKLSDLTVSILQVQAGENVRQEIDRIGVSQGFTVFTDVIDYKVTAEAHGQTLEIHDFGGAYSIRTIKLDRNDTNSNLVAVQYIPGNRTVVFVPAKMETAADGTNEAILNVPHNSMYTVVNVQARTFADLTGHWAKADVEHLASKLLVNGVAADHFESEGTITRAEFSALLIRGLGLSVKESEDGNRFVDVPASAWYASAVNAAVASGLVSGIGAGRFAPNDTITREQMAVVIASALTFTSHGSSSHGQEGGHLDTFTDRDSISSWAQAAVVRVSKDGIMNGMEDRRFAPKEYVTRAQAAVILKRFLQFVHFID